MISVVKIAENDTNSKEDSELVHVADDMIGQHGSWGKKGVLGRVIIYLLCAPLNLINEIRTSFSPRSPEIYVHSRHIH